MAKTFFEASENSRLVAGLDIYHPAGGQTGLDKRGRKEILARDAP